MRYTFFLPCPKGLEDVLLEELQNLDARHHFGLFDVQKTHAGVRFQGSMAAMYWCNLYSRVASRVLLLLKSGQYYDEHDIYDLAYQTQWHNFFSEKNSIRVDTSAHKSPLQSLQFTNLKVKDGICDAFLRRTGMRPSVDTQRPEVRIFAHVDQSHVYLYLDTSGEALFKRGWRWDKGSAPMKENLAAGILYMAGWHKKHSQLDCMFMDTMCGSGTLAIEAAQIATHYPAGLMRDFSFIRLKVFDANLWQTIQLTARDAIITLAPGRIFASDIDPSVMSIAQENIGRAKVTGIQCSVENAKNMLPSGQHGVMVINPPYGERIFLKQKDGQVHPQDTFLTEWASHLKKHYAGWQIFILTADLQTPTYMRLKPQQKTVLFNGDLECRLFRFDMVAGSMRQDSSAQAPALDANAATDTPHHHDNN